MYLGRYVCPVQYDDAIQMVGGNLPRPHRTGPQAAM